MLTLPTAVLDSWRRIWGRSQPEVALVVDAPDIGFVQPNFQAYSFPLGIAGAGGAQVQTNPLEEGIYDCTWWVAYVSAGAGDQQMIWRAQIRDQNNKVTWSVLMPTTTGQNVVLRKRCALRNGYAVFLANEVGVTLAGTYSVVSVSADPVF